MKGELLVYQSFIHGVSTPAINEYQLRLDVQRFLWPVYYIIYAGPLSCILGVKRYLYCVGGSDIIGHYILSPSTASPIWLPTRVCSHWS